MTTPAIPRTIHRIWLGGPMPAEVAELGARWQELHPGWTVRTWRDWDLPALINQAHFDGAAHPAQRSDIARFELLHRFGGVYVDTDLIPQRPLDDLVAAVHCFLASEDGRWVSTGVIGAVPRHPFIAELIDGIPASLENRRDEPINTQTGPKYVTAKYQEWCQRHPDGGGVVLFPPELFYPYHFSEPWRAGEDFPDAYAVHDWHGTWTEPAS